MKAKPLLKKRNLLNLFECLESWFSFYTSTISDIFFCVLLGSAGMGTFQKKKWEKKCGARDNPGQGERRMSYYRDRGEWLLFLGQPAAPTIHPYASEIMLSACPYQRNTLPKKFNFLPFLCPEFFSFGRGRRWLTWLGVLYSPLSILLPLQICPSLTSGDAESRSNLSRLHIVPIIFIKYPISADYWGKHSWKKFWLYSKPILVFFKFVSK